ncbi:COX assembly mitochondrial protein 2 homolog [Chrysoperla carnea]|uniref:COX assembly mitochondrial protein 2 homolog n=1 Tax=Chrysoperla carnea TaxID=189513 RepID=UPI001D0769D8|nr:COX assembly mitochondrial protein 2 homolog [Chrysoperla carnea]
MHTDLSPHLHSSQCVVLINKLKECHENHPLRKFVGYCNEIDAAMLKCLKGERQERSRRNRQNAKEKQERIRNLLKEQAAKEEAN